MADLKATAHTQVITPTKKDGVIDRAEWDRMLAEIDAKNAREKEMAAAVEENKADEGEVGVVGTRAARHASSKKTAFAGLAAAKAKDKKEKPKKAKTKKQTEVEVDEKNGEKKPDRT